MQPLCPDLSCLFAQLGEAHDDDSIERFIHRNTILLGTIRVDEAPCWSRAQAAFLREALALDDHWALVVDVLNTQMHQR
jgi:hypothetical protein